MNRFNDNILVPEFELLPGRSRLVSFPFQYHLCKDMDIPACHYFFFVLKSCLDTFHTCKYHHPAKNESVIVYGATDLRQASSWSFVSREHAKHDTTVTGYRITISISANTRLL
jgi:hypothetical protein